MLIKNRIDACFIHLKDLEQGREWYTNILGFEIESTDEWHCSFKMEGTKLILLKSHHEEIPKLPYAVFNFFTEDISNAYSDLQNKGVEVGEIEHFGEAMEGCHFSDPEGNLLLVCTEHR